MRQASRVVRGHAPRKILKSRVSEMAFPARRFYRILKIIKSHINYKTHKALEIISRVQIGISVHISSDLYYREGKQEASLVMK